MTGYRIDRETEQAVDMVSRYLHAKDRGSVTETEEIVKNPIDGNDMVEITIESGLTNMSFQQRRAIAREIVEIVQEQSGAMIRPS